MGSPLSNLAHAALAAALLATSLHAASGKAQGTATARLVIELYSDFECPACKGLHEQTIQPLIRDYVRAGKVYLIHKDFPLPMHAHSRPAARLAVAAARIGKYNEVADALFAKQEQWSKTGKVEEAAFSVLTPAEQAKVKALAATPEVNAEIEKDIQAGKAANLTQTPTMIIINGGKKYPVAGQVSYDVLQRFLDSQLAVR